MAVSGLNLVSNSIKPKYSTWMHKGQSTLFMMSMAYSMAHHMQWLLGKTNAVTPNVPPSFIFTQLLLVSTASYNNTLVHLGQMAWPYSLPSLLLVCLQAGQCEKQKSLCKHCSKTLECYQQCFRLKSKKLHHTSHCEEN